MAEVADEILVKKAQGGDLAAYGELVRRYQDRVYGLTVRMLGASEDARDATQDIFIRTFRSLPEYDFRSGFATWLYRVSSNLCLDLLRRHKREQQHCLPLEEGKIREDRLQDDRPGPEELLLEQERLEGLRQAVDCLPEGYRLALVLHHYQELSYRQVAEVMELPEKTVATRIHRAKLMLREKLLGGDGGAMPDSQKNNQPVPGRGMSAL